MSYLVAASLWGAAVPFAGLGVSVAEPAAPDPAPPTSTSPTASASPSPAPSSSTSSSPSPAASQSPPGAPGTPATAIDHDGTYAVGTELAPGVYASAGPIEGGTCSWRRIGTDPADPTQPATLDNAISKKPQVVQIEPTDKAFKTRGCQPWQQTDSAPPAETPPWLAQLQLRQYLDTLNGLAGQSGNGQLPPS